MLAVGGTAIAQPVGPSTPVPVPARPTAAATPAPSTSPSPAPGRRGRRSATPEPGPSASETPEPPQFSTMDGVWEVQVQPLNGARAIYSHLYVTQKGDALTGTWARTDKVRLPFTGTFDGRLFKLTATDEAAKATVTLSGYAENFSDMVGLMVTADPKDRGTPF